MDRYELRRLDYSLSSHHVDLQTAYKQFFKTHCPIETAVPRNQPVSTTACGSGCAQWARRRWRYPNPVVATARRWSISPWSPRNSAGRWPPVPWIDHVCAARLLASLGALDAATAPEMATVAHGEQLAALDPRMDNVDGVRLIPTGSIADHIIVRMVTRLCA